MLWPDHYYLCYPQYLPGAAFNSGILTDKNIDQAREHGMTILKSGRNVHHQVWNHIVKLTAVSNDQFREYVRPARFNAQIERDRERIERERKDIASLEREIQRHLDEIAFLEARIEMTTGARDAGEDFGEFADKHQRPFPEFHWELRRDFND